jgi:hypothetical protein
LLNHQHIVLTPTQRELLEYEKKINPKKLTNGNKQTINRKGPVEHTHKTLRFQKSNKRVAM